MTGDYFTPEEVARASRYRHPLYLTGAAGLALDVLVLALLSWTVLGDALDPGSLPWWARTPLYAAIVVAVLTLVGVPLSLWTSLVRERRWGLSTQTLSSWLSDLVKALLVNAVLAALAFLAIVAVARALPGWWVVPVAVALAGFAVLLSFLAPVVLEPLFNRYEPLEDEELAGSLRELASRAGAPVRDVLVQDASRRTRKANAYVSGLGNTRRVVVSDTLLEQAPPPEIRLVVAHELGHRRHRHVAWGTLLFTAVVIAGTAVVWAVFGPDVADPHRIPEVMLLGLGLGVLVMPLMAATSRSWERTADRFALTLTRDPAAYRGVFLRLARTNLSDLDPPRVVYLLSFSHPTPPERLAAAST